jgi:EmrB/QacA subfamily drug resistance transporter
MKQRAFTLLAMCLCAFIISMDTTIVNVVLPALVRQLRATTTDLQWVVDAYSLVFAALVLVIGSLSDRFGRKGMLLAGLGVFGAASLAGSFAATPGQLIAARVVMGIGAAMIYPSTLSLLTNVFTARRERAQAIGLWGATTGIGIALGPIIGGALLGGFWWGSIFLFLAPVAVVVAAMVAWQVPTSRDPAAPRVDWPGFLLSTAGMGLLVFGVIQAPGWGWGSMSSIGAIVAGIAVLAVFGLVERVVASPMLDVRLFRDMRFTAASGSVSVAFFALMGFIFLMTQYFQVVRSYSALSTGVRLLPVAFAVGFFSVLGTRLAVRIGNKAIVATGLLCYAVGFAWMATVSPTTPYGLLAVQMMLLGTGMGLTTAPATEAIMGAVRPEQAGIGSAVNDATRLFGAALGVAVIGSVAGSLYTSKLAATLPRGIPAAAVAAARGSVGGAAAAAQQLSHLGQAAAALAHSLTGAAQLAFMHGMAGGCAVASGMSAAGMLLVVRFLPARPHPVPAAPAEPTAESTPESTGEAQPTVI